MTKTISVSKKVHKKIKKDAADEGLSMRDYVESKFAVFAICVLFTAALATSYAFAEPGQLQYEEDQLAGIEVFPPEFETIESGVLKRILVQFEYFYPNEADKPPQDYSEVVILDKDGKFIVVNIKDGIVIDNKIIPDEKTTTAEIEEPEEQASSTTDIDKKVLDDFEKCFGGLEQSYAFQMEYSFEKFVRQYLRDIGTRDKLAEECIAVSHILNYSNTAYPGLIVREDTSTKTTDFETRNFPQKSVTEEDIEQVEESIQYPPWYQDPYSEWTGKNRGTSEPIIGNATGNLMGREKTTAEIYAEYKAEKAAAILTDRDVANIAKQAQTTLCEIAFKTAGYGHLAIDKWRTMLLDGTCDGLLSEEFISKWRPGFSSLDQVRDYRLSLDQEIEAGRQ